MVTYVRTLTMHASLHVRMRACTCPNLTCKLHPITHSSCQSNSVPIRTCTCQIVKQVLSRGNLTRTKAIENCCLVKLHVVATKLGEIHHLIIDQNVCSSGAVCLPSCLPLNADRDCQVTVNKHTHMGCVCFV